MATIRLGFDLRSSESGASHPDMVAALLDMCEWADKLEGVGSATSFPEHHASPDGYIPSPIVLAAAVAGRTRKMAISVILVLPLYHPLRLAEDLAILDLVSQGRVTFLFGAGYRKAEFDALGVDLADRGKLMEEGIETLKKAWTGEPFEFRGNEALVTPRPLRQPRPPILMGGSSKAAARRAARIADGFMPTSPVFIETYKEELAALGKPPPPPPPPGMGGPMVTVVAVSEDPEATWNEVAPHCLHEMKIYAEWLRGATGQVDAFWDVANVGALRETGRYLVLTPEQFAERARAAGGNMAISPMTGGISPQTAWKSLKLIETQVLPTLK